MRIVRVLAPNADVYTLEGTNTYVVGADPAIVIDPGPDDEGHLVEVRREAGTIGAIVLTHQHPDHAPGAAPLVAATGAPLYAFRPPEGGEALRDGQVVRAGKVQLTAVHTPGHTPDHIVLLLEAERVLFTGDAVLGRGTSLIDPPEGDLTAYLRSLHRMRDLAPRTIYPGHGPIVLDGTGKLDEYLAHRQEREQQIISALGDGSRSISELVDAIYDDYPDAVKPLAARSVLAHLLKLEGDGRAGHIGHGDDARYELLEQRACERCGRPVTGRAKLCERCQLTALQEGPAE
ncbi:MAG: MBL fold metallo-hydrolase [Actinomycetota bacterium]